MNIADRIGDLLSRTYPERYTVTYKNAHSQKQRMIVRAGDIKFKIKMSVKGTFIIGFKSNEFKIVARVFPGIFAVAAYATHPDYKMPRLAKGEVVGPPPSTVPNAYFYYHRDDKKKLNILSHSLNLINIREGLCSSGEFTLMSSDMFVRMEHKSGASFTWLSRNVYHFASADLDIIIDHNKRTVVCNNECSTTYV